MKTRLHNWSRVQLARSFVHAALQGLRDEADRMLMESHPPAYDTYIEALCMHRTVCTKETILYFFVIARIGPMKLNIMLF